jgi:invasion protein IalB
MRGIFLSLSLVTAFGLSAPTPLLAQDAAATPDAAVAPAKKAKPVIKKPAGNAPATAAAPDVVAQQFGNWQVGCPKAAKGKEKCAARMVVSDTKRKVALLTWVFGYNQKGEMLSEILSPMDVYIGPRCGDQTVFNGPQSQHESQRHNRCNIRQKHRIWNGHRWPCRRTEGVGAVNPLFDLL